MHWKADLGKRMARAQFPLILSSLKKRKLAFNTIKDGLDFPDLCDAIDFIERNFPPEYRQQAFGHPLPSGYDNLGVCEFCYTGDSIVKEINWILVGVRKYAAEINAFLKYKEQFETEFITGNYYEAEKILSKTEKEVCYSLWTLENRFLYKEYNQSSRVNKEYLVEFNEINRSQTYTKSLAHYLSIRAEKTLSTTRFNADLKAAVNAIKGSKKMEHVDYYLFKLSYHNNLEFSHYTEILSYDFYHSIIDRYLNLRKVLINLLTISVHMEEEKEKGRQIQTYVINRINYLLRKIEDPVLYKLKLISTDKHFLAESKSTGNTMIELSDRFLRGEYKEVEEQVKLMLPRNPLQFDLYILYIQALVYQNKEFGNVGNEKSLQNEILGEMFKIVSLKADSATSVINLLRIANNLTSAVLSYGIIDFVFFQTKGQTERKIFSRLSYTTTNPNFYEIFINKDTKQSYLEFLQKQYPDSLAVNFNLAKVSDISAMSQFKGQMPEWIYLSEYANVLQEKDNFEEAEKCWRYLIDKYPGHIQLQELAAGKLFICLQLKKDYDGCIQLFTDIFFKNEKLVEKIETAPLLEKIKEGRFRSVKATIDLPIFYSIVSSDETETHIAYEKFNISQEVLRPTEYLARFKAMDQKKMIHFLKYACAPEILKHSIHIEGSKERLEERLSICQFLRDVDASDKSFYDDEIKNISNILIIQQGRIELDESKIYVNETGIINNELKDFEPVYLRFKTISGISEKQKILFLDKRRLTTVEYSKEKTEQEKIEYSNNPVFDIYKELFEAIKEKFLYSKFGIVAYLSTRIRHGVLLGEIRPVFEKHKLITHKEGEATNYKKNEYWDQLYRFQPQINSQVQYLLNDFSNSVDGLIYDLIKKYLQVKDEIKNPEGWFDFDFDDDKLFLQSIASIALPDFQSFVNGIFAVLWDRTDENLEVIRDHINTQVTTKFNDLFNTLERDVLDAMPANQAQPLITQIKACWTDVQMVIERISHWFKRSGTQMSDFTLENLINIVLEYSDKQKQILITKQIDCPLTFKGEYYTHFADLLRIFIENILKHAKKEAEFIPADIHVGIEADKVIIKIANVNLNIEKAAQLPSYSSDDSVATKKLFEEERSGYVKARKILISDLKNDKNSFKVNPANEEGKYSVTVSLHYKDLTI